MIFHTIIRLARGLKKWYFLILVITESQKFRAMRHLLASVDQLLYLSGKEIQSQRSGVAFLTTLSVSGADSRLECMFSDWVSFPVSSSSLPPSAWRQQGRMFRAGSCCFLLRPMHCDSFGKSGDPWGSGRGCILTPCLTHVSIALSHLGGAPSTPRLSLPVYTKLALLFSGQELTKQEHGGGLVFLSVCSCCKVQAM